MIGLFRRYWQGLHCAILGRGIGIGMAPLHDLFYIWKAASGTASASCIGPSLMKKAEVQPLATTASSQIDRENYF